MKHWVEGVMRRTSLAPARDPPALALAHALGVTVVDLGSPFRVPVKMKVGRLAFTVTINSRF